MFRGSKTRFERHKRERVREADSIIELSQRKKPAVAAPTGKLFYEVEFHEDALSKSSQPRKLLEANNIDIYAQVSERNFLASSTAQNLKSFRDSISRFKLADNKNESAYLSAITKISLINKDEKLTFVPKKGERFKTYLFLADVLSEEEGRGIASQVGQKSSTDTEFFVSQSGAKVIYGSFTKGFLDEISDADPRNPIVRVEKSIDFFTPQELALEYEYDNVEIEKPLLDAKLAVVDSGIYDHPLLKGLLLGTEDCIKDSSLEDLSHGTFVAGRAIFGNDLEAQLRDNKRVVPSARILDVKVMRKVGNQVGANDKQILEALLKVLENQKYKDIKVFNLSLNFNDDENTVRNGTKCFFTRELDAIAYKYKICVIVTAGNHSVCTTEAYPDCLYNAKALITPPADLMNGISVGSIADSESSRALALNNEPSPFTRMGPVGSKKPDLAHFGGNCDKYGDYAGVGVRSLSTHPKKLYENAGTSFAAPLVSNIAAQIYAFLANTGRESADLTKALLLHSADFSLPISSKINSDDLPRLVGFGIPDFSRALDSASSAATFIYTGKIEAKKQETGEVKEYKHKLKFIVPPELGGKHRKLRIRGTMVYTPLTSESGLMDYAQANIDVNLHYRNSRGTDRSAGLTSESRDHRVKWNTVKSFQKTFSHFKGGEWEIWLTLTTRGKAEVDDYVQEYALVISVEDVTPDISKRIDLHQVIREQYSMYVPITQRVRSRVQT